MFWAVDALLRMWLQKLPLDVKDPYLCSEAVVLSEIWCPPLVVPFSYCPRLVFLIWLSLTRIISVEFSGCIKYEFKPFLVMKVAGSVLVLSLALNRIGSHKSKSAIAISLILFPNRSSTGVLPLVFEVLRCVISATCGNAQMTHWDWDSTLEVPASLSELLFQQVH